MKRRFAAIFLAVVAGLALLGLWSLWRARRASTPPASGPAAAPEAPAETVELTLYFPGEDGRLYAERREVPSAAEPVGRARAALTALLSGPRGEGLRAPLPAGVEIGAVTLVGDGTVVVDLRSAGHELPPASGSLGERSMVYSLVDTVLLNVDGSKRVTLLWNGMQRESFSGHLDTARPLVADTSLIAAP